MKYDLSWKTDDFVECRKKKTLLKVQQSINRGNKKHAELLQTFVKYMQDNKKSEETIAGYTNHITKVLKKYEGNIKNYSSKDWTKFWEEDRPETWKKGAGSRLAQCAMTKLLTMIHGNTYTAKDKIDRILYSKYEKLKITRKKHAYKTCLNYEEVKKLVNVSLNSRDRFLVMMLWDTAGRVSELLSCRMSDIDFKARPVEIQIRESKTASGENVVFLHDSMPFLMQWLKDHPYRLKYSSEEEFLNSNAPLICSIKYKLPMNRDGVLIELKRLAERAGIKKRIYSHLFRRSRITALYRHENFSIGELKELGRWSRIDTLLNSYLGADIRAVGKKLSKNGMTEQEKKELEEENTLIKKERESMQPIKCPQCETENPFGTSYCNKCACPVSDKAKFLAWQENKKTQEKLTKLTTQMAQMGNLQKELSSMKKILQQKKQAII